MRCRRRVVAGLARATVLVAMSSTRVLGADEPAERRVAQFERHPDVILHALPRFDARECEGLAPVVRRDGVLLRAGPPASDEPQASRSLDELQPGSSALQTPAPFASFVGVGDTATAPPDTMGAVGPRHLMETANGAYAVYDKRGTPILTVPIDSFWSGITKDAGDSVIVYDRFAGRWIIVAADSGNTDRGGIEIAVSQTDDPTGTWSRFRTPSPATEWHDQPMAGLNSRTLTISAGAIGGPSNPKKDRLLRTDILLVDKEQLFRGTLSAPVVSSGGFAICPALSYDSAGATNYLVETGRNVLALYEASVSGLRQTLIDAPSSWASQSPGGDFLPQRDTTIKIDASTSRIHSVVMRNGVLWVVHTVFLPVNAPTRTGIQWWKISTAGQILDVGRIDDSSSGTSYAYGSIAVNGNEDVVIGFSQFSSQTFASAGYAFRAASDPPGTFRPPVLFKSGEGRYRIPNSTTRWGDYSNTMIDLDELTFWTVQEYAAAPRNGADQWGTWWAQIRPPGTRRRTVRH